MNKEFSKNEEVATLEANEKPKILAIEAEKSDEEFAGEILSKIENEMNSEPSSQVEMQKIDSSVKLNNPSTNGEIKKELDLENKLSDLDNEIKVAGEETKSKISEISGFSKAYHHPEYRKNTTKQILEARKTGGDAEKIRKEFYEKTANEKESFESQEKERSIAEIMKEKDLVVVHAIPLRGEGRGSQENNPMLRVAKQQEVNFGDSLEMIAGLSPTISTSIPSPDRFNNGLFKKTGVILGEGKILSAQSGDSGSVAHGLFKRIPKYGEGEKNTAIQPQIDIEKTAKKSEDSSRGEMWNELTVEKPQIAGLFYDMSEPLITDPNKEFLIQKGVPEKEINEKYEEWRNERLKELLKEQEFELMKMKEYSEKINVPLYAFKSENGKLNKYKVDFVSDPSITEDYLKNIMVPKSNEILARNNRNFSSSEFLEFTKEFDRAERILEGKEYILTLVTAKDIYESKREISNEEKKKMIEDIKTKGILSESAEKEVDKKFQNLN